VITEDDYIEFLSLGPATRMVPIGILKKLLNDSRLLFLGYSLRDWNLRVIIRKVLKEGVRTQSYAINLDATELERETWDRHRVQINRIELGKFIEELEDRLDTSLAIR
jgi:hypothetical protein